MSQTEYGRFIRALFEQNQFAIKYDLESMRDACDRIGLNRIPQPFTVLVGGTNGKGTVSSALHAAFVQAGFRTGLYTSPHLVDFRERIRLNGEPISIDDCVNIGTELFERFSGREHPAETPRPLSYFELTSLLAFQYFRPRVDVQVLEVGLGGRLDATNCVEPDVSVITNVSLDHQAWLGNSTAEIAAEKAQIARPARPCLLLESAAGINELHAAVTRVGADIELVGSSNADGPDASRELARAAFLTCMARLRPMTGAAPLDDVWETAQAKTRWPGRQEVRHYDGREYLIDGAHNEASILACATWLREELARRGRGRVAAIIGCSPGRDVSVVFEPLVSMLSEIHCVPADAQRSLPPDDVAKSLGRITSAPIAVHADFATAVEQTRGEGPTLIVGSLYLVGTALGHFRETPESLRVLA